MKTVKSIILFLAAVAPVMGFGKDSEVTETKYTRSSIYSMLVSHNNEKFGKEIKEQFLDIPTPDQYNNHDLSVKVINVEQKVDYKDSIDAFINDNLLASRMVAKWFDRDMLTGQCGIGTLTDRSIYNATELEKEMASRSARGMNMLTDAGEELIGRSFLLVNDITYVDKSKKSGIFGAGLKILGTAAAMATGNTDLMNLGNSMGDIAASLKGFKVKITTHLYQLVWDDEAAGIFYKDCYASAPDEAKRQAFERNRHKFHFKYVGCVESAGSNTSFLGINEDEPMLMVRKACQRAIDNNVADLQKNYDQFRIKAPLIEENGVFKAQIGLKEGLTAESKFEVLEAQEKNGRTVYKKVGEVKPVDKKIWDNRYMASEEQAYGADFGATTFQKVSGGDLYSGLLIRQID